MRDYDELLEKYETLKAASDKLLESIEHFNVAVNGYGRYQGTFNSLKEIMEPGKVYNSGFLKRKLNRELSPYLNYFVQTGQIDRVGHGKYKLNAKA